MSLKPKTSRRLALAGVLVLLAVGAVVAFVFVRQWQKERASVASRAEGMQFYQQHAYTQAAEKLRLYLRLRQKNLSDAEAWRTLGDCYEHDEQPEFRHVRAAIDAYSRVTDLEPADRASAVKLLALYNRVGLYQEAQTLAARLRPARVADAGPETFEVLREEAAARAGLKLFDDRLAEIADRMVALRPDDFAANLLKVACLRENKRGAEALAHATEVAARHPDSRPLKLLLVLVSYQESGGADPAAYLAALTDVAGLDPNTGAVVTPVDFSDKEFVFRLVSLFDSTERFGHSEAVLRQAAARPEADPEVLRLWARRAWQFGRHADIVGRLATLDLSPGGDHSELLAFKAMSLRDLGRAAEARPIADALKARTNFRAVAWTMAFETLPEVSGAAPAGPSDSVKKAQGAMKECPGEPIFSMFLGQAYAALGRSEEAVEAWTEAARYAPGWAAPLIEASRVLLNNSRPDEAYVAASNALRANPKSLSANVAFLNAQASLIEQGGKVPGDLREVAVRLEEAALQVESVTDPAARRSLQAGIVPARAILAVRAGRPDDARAIIRGALDAPGEADPALLRRLAMLSAREKLGLEDQCLARADKDAVQTPAGALARALTLHELGRSAEALEYLRKASEAAGSDRAAWSRAVARFLDATGNPGALDMWKSLCDASPDDLALQLDALRAPSSAQDIAFIDRLTERVNRLSNAEQTRPLVVVRTARARALLSGNPTARARDEAIGILRSLVLESGDSNEVRSLLVTALLMDAPERSIRPDIPGALEQLRVMLERTADKPQITLEIATLLHRQREYERAREQLSLVANAADARTETRLRAIDLLIAQADFAGAIGPFRAILDAQGERAEPARWLKLASVYRALRQDAQAQAIYRRLAANPPDDPEQLVQIADGLAVDGKRAEADALLARLDSMKLEPGRRELMLATFAERRSDPQRAVEQYEKAIAAAPERAEVWARYAQFRAGRSEFDQAEDLIKRGLERTPGAAELRVVEQQLAVRRSDRGEINMSNLVEAMASDPAYKEKAEVVRFVEEMRRDGRLATVKGVDELRARYPGEMAVQTLAARLYSRLAPPRFDLAVAVARDSMQAFPTSPEPAILATELFREMANWPEMLKAAQSWQQLTRSSESDLSIAEAHLNLDQTRQAIEQLKPYVDAALKDHSSMVSVAALGLHARALVASGRSAEALELLRPLLKDSQALRNRVAIPIAATYARSEADSILWLQAVEPLIAADDVEGRLAMATAWGTVAVRSKTQRDAFLDRALAVVKPLTQAPAATAARAHETIGALLRQRGDFTGAAEAYRRAIAADPQRSSSMQGLADLLIASGGDPSEAIALSERAASVEGPQARGPQFLSARAHQYHAMRLDGAGKHAEALAAFKRAADGYRPLAAIDPPDTGALLGLAEVSDALGDLDTSIASYERALANTNLTPQDRAGAQNNLAYALLRSNKGSAALDRARAMVLDAIAAAEVGAFVDTLASIEAARGDRAAAIKAYGRAIELDATMTGSRIELAALLANGGTAEDRARARGLLDEAAKAPVLTPAQRSRIDEVRRAIDAAK